MERQNQPSDDSSENYYLQEHYREDIYITPGSKDQTFESHVNNVSNPKKSEGFEEDEVMSPAARDYFSFLDKNVGSKRFKNRMEKSSQRNMKSSSLPSMVVSTCRKINLIDSIKQDNWKVTGKRSRCTNCVCNCNGYSLPLDSPKGSRLNCVVEEESEAVNLLLGLKESIMQGRGDEDEELGGYLFKKRKVDEAENQDSSDDNKIKTSDNNESDIKKSDHSCFLPNPNCSVDSVGSRPQSPISPKRSDVNDIDHHDEQQSNLKSSEDIKQPVNPICSNDSEINMFPKDKKSTIRAGPKSYQESEKTDSDGSKECKCTTCGAIFKSFQALGGHKKKHTTRVRTERINDDSFVSRPQHPNQESQKRGADDHKEYKCTTCGVSFKSFRALGGHKSNHTIRVRTEKVVTDDNQGKEKKKIQKSSGGSEEVASYGCGLCPKSYNTLKQLKMHQRCHGLNVGSHDRISQSPSTILHFDLNVPAAAEDSDFSSPAY